MFFYEYSNEMVQSSKFVAIYEILNECNIASNKQLKLVIDVSLNRYLSAFTSIGIRKYYRSIKILR